MSDLDTFTTSDQLSSDLVTKAVSSPQELKRLVVRVSEVAGPERGWTRLLDVIAKASVAEWMEGDLQVDFTGDDKGTTIAFYAVLGVGIRERLFGAQFLAVPIDEFQRTVLRTPAIVAPLRAHQGLNQMTLALGERVRNKDMPEFELEEKAKGDGERITAPPPPDLVIEEAEVHTRPTIPPPSE